MYMCFSEDDYGPKIENLSSSERVLQKSMEYSLDDDIWPKFSLIVFCITDKYAQF